MKRGIVGILVMVMVLSCCLVGCGGQASNANGDAVNTSQEKIVWKVQGYTPAETLYDFYGSRLAENITTMSQGRLTIEWHPADTIVPSVDGLQAARDGV